MKTTNVNIQLDKDELKVISFSGNKAEGVFVPADKLRQAIYSAMALHECLATPVDSENAIQAAMLLDQLKGWFNLYVEVVGPYEAGLYDDEAMKKILNELEVAAKELRGPEPTDAA